VKRWLKQMKTTKGYEAFAAMGIPFMPLSDSDDEAFEEAADAVEEAADAVEEAVEEAVEAAEEVPKVVEEPYEVKLGGIWIVPDTEEGLLAQKEHLVEIEVLDSVQYVVHWDEVTNSALRRTDESTVALMFDGEECMGEISADGRQLVWSDGDVWERQAAPPRAGEEGTPKSAEELLDEIRSLSVEELAQHLSERELDSEGTKAMLVSRLEEALLDEIEEAEITAAGLSSPEAEPVEVPVYTAAEVAERLVPALNIAAKKGSSYASTPRSDVEEHDRRASLQEVYRRLDAFSNGRVDAGDLLALARGRRKLQKKSDAWEDSQEVDALCGINIAVDGTVSSDDFVNSFSQELPHEKEEFDAILEEYLAVAAVHGETTRTALAGQWRAVGDDDGQPVPSEDLVSIKSIDSVKHVAHWYGGAETPLQRGPVQITMDFEGEKVTGEISLNGKHLQWSDGDVWARVIQPVLEESPQVPTSTAELQNALRSLAKEIIDQQKAAKKGSKDTAKVAGGTSFGWNIFRRSPKKRDA